MNIFFGLALCLWLWNCTGGMMGPANKATESDGSSSAGGGALDEVGINVAGNMGPGPGGPPGSGGSMTGSGGPGDPTGGAGGGAGGGGGGGPFDDVGAGGGGATPGSGTECSGGHCSTDSPSGVLLGKFPISVSLFYDPDTQGGNCNDLWPPPKTLNNCQLQLNSSQSTPVLESLFLGRAWALPQNFPAGDVDAKTVCDPITFQPPIDPNLIPKVEIKSRESLFPIQINMYDQTFDATCSPNGRWTVTTPLITVNLRSSGNIPNIWHFDITALYPINGIWRPRGTQTLQMNCELVDGGQIVCKGQVLPPTDFISAPLIPNTLTR